MIKKRLGINALTLAMAASGMTGFGSASTDNSAETSAIPTETTAAVTETPSVTTETAAESADETTPESSDPFSVVCTIFPEYDWVKEILGDHADNAELTYLLDSGADLHNYQPTADDIIKISTCDLFVYVGGESDVWVEDALSGATNKDMKVINLMDVLGDQAKIEELKEGMQES